MEKVIDKELISQLLRLEKGQQDRVLGYIKDMLAREKGSRAKGHDFFASAGMWKGREIDAEQLRSQAWKRGS